HRRVLQAAWMSRLDLPHHPILQAVWIPRLSRPRSHHQSRLVRQPMIATRPLATAAAASSARSATTPRAWAAAWTRRARAAPGSSATSATPRSCYSPAARA
ncbi:unnamed protein product, partial [Prorocentrum cordatum]